ncbi:hypothetical protein H257_18548 [Aphanomyces astaci]|uniref:Peptidase S1 domain-containing protein n=1 Tax=Aphanomyces astaci TaxID=112090 RepID=W4FAS7_APHAT|nr:hypothetical protein H257_18548 [Aphanomyces astaci]ETV64585.1 hypothetical protein H257_18548 [Aphanomyces astaci]|eukprot:XP_009845941.1 hypothetical protein H257_18548 [Aphanomyces astaci]
MKFALLLAVTVAVAALAQDQIVPPKVAWGDEAPADGFEILGGEEAQQGKHRYVARVKHVTTAPSICAGSLIAPNVVLTVAHCNIAYAKFVVVGTHYLYGSDDGELANVAQAIRHPNVRVDLGILILDRNITSIQPVAVSFEYVPADVVTWVRGWGNINIKVGGPRSTVLKELNVTTWNNTRAAAAFGIAELRAHWLGAGGVEGEDTCSSDSGGAMTIEENGTVRLVGVIKGGKGCGSLGKPGIYERTSASRAFIEPYLPK